MGTSPVLGRAAEIAWLRQAVVTRTTVGVHGPAGTGVSTLLAHLAHADLDLEADVPWPVRRILVHAGDAGADAILADIELRLGDRLPRPAVGEQVVVVLDDLRGGSAVLGQVLGALPRYTFLIGSQHPMLAPDRSLALAGLPQDAALYLLFSGMRRVLTPADHAGALHLVAALGGVPGELVRAAQAVRRGETTYARLAAGVAGPVTGSVAGTGRIEAGPAQARPGGPTTPTRPGGRPHRGGGRRTAGAGVPLLLTTVLALAVVVAGLRLAVSRSQVDAAAAATPSATALPGTRGTPQTSSSGGPAAPVRPVPPPSSPGPTVTPSTTGTPSPSGSTAASAAPSWPTAATAPGGPGPPPEPVGTFGSASPEPAGVLVVVGGQDAGQVRLGTSTRSDVVLRNSGRGPLTVDSAQVSSDPGGPFTVLGSSCTVLAPAADCTVTVGFAPDRLGTARATLDVGTAQGAPTQVRLAGTGFAELTVTVDGTVDGAGGAGVSSVVSEDGAWACTGRCVLRVRSPGQSVIVLRAVPGKGAVLERWSGDCSGTGDRCELQMTGDRSVTAHLVPAGG